MRTKAQRRVIMEDLRHRRAILGTRYRLLLASWSGSAVAAMMDRTRNIDVERTREERRLESRRIVGRRRETPMNVDTNGREAPARRILDRPAPTAAMVEDAIPIIDDTKRSKKTEPRKNTRHLKDRRPKKRSWMFRRRRRLLHQRLEVWNRESNSYWPRIHLKLGRRWTNVVRHHFKMSRMYRLWRSKLSGQAIWRWTYHRGMRIRVLPQV